MPRSTHGRLHDSVVSLLPENKGIAFYGTRQHCAFEISTDRARRFLAARNPNGRPNSDVVRPWVGVTDILHRPRHTWTVDFPSGMDEREAMLYELPFAHVRRCATLAERGRRKSWWTHGTPQIEMRIAVAKRERFIATPAVSRHHVFVWFPPETLPDRRLIVFARDDDWFFGVLHSRFHQVWARRVGTQLREKASGFRHTPTTCLETFPFPWPPATPLGKLTRAQEDRRTAIAAAAWSLNAQRRGWLGNHTDPTRTLATLYDSRPEWLQNAHVFLDEAVAAAYGWPVDLSDDEVTAGLLALRQERVGTP
jgi:hypothetical protein